MSRGLQRKGGERGMGCGRAELITSQSKGKRYEPRQITLKMNKVGTKLCNNRNAGNANKNSISYLLSTPSTEEETTLRA